MIDNKNAGIFPPELQHLQVSLNQAESTLKSLDEAIENLPQDRGPRLTFSPPGAPNSTGYNRENSIRHFNAQKQQVVTSFMEYAGQEMANTDPATASKLNSFIQYRLSDNPYKDQGREQLKAQRDIVKKDEKSDDPKKSKMFDFMASLHYSQFDEQPGQTANKEEGAAIAPHIDERDFTDSFFDTLKNYKNQQGIESPSEPGSNAEDVDPDIEDF